MNIYRRSNKQQIRNEKKGRKFTIYFHKFIKRRKKKKKKSMENGCLNGKYFYKSKIIHFSLCEEVRATG